jgi:carbon storage regulator
MGLVLSRKERETIFIGNDITITVVQIKGERVRIDLDVPRDVPVLRGELLDKIRDRQGAA